MRKTIRRLFRSNALFTIGIIICMLWILAASASRRQAAIIGLAPISSGRTSSAVSFTAGATLCSPGF